MRVLHIILLGMLAIVLLNCANQKTAINEVSKLEDTVQIEYLASFGMCLGRCVRQAKFTSSGIDYVERPWREVDSLPPLHTTLPLSENDRNELIELLDLTTFMKTDSVIGCPDCRDEGAETFRITSNHRTHHVKISYFKPLPGNEEFANRIRGLIYKQ